MDHWENIPGNDVSSMTSLKLSRISDTTWDPPILTFEIERHGGFVQGSSKSEVQMWAYNTDTQSLSANVIGYRQTNPLGNRVATTRLALDIFQSIMKTEDKDGLEWQQDGTIRVSVPIILPAGDSPKQTIDGRRRRFREELAKRMTDAGWTEIKRDVFRLPDITQNEY